MSEKADKLFLGHIVTLDARLPILEAVTVKDGLVQYAGSLRVAKMLCDEHTEVIDYGENYVYPGFIDGHCHGGLAGSRLAYFADLTSGNSMDEYVEMMKKFAADHPDNEFLYGAGWKLIDKMPTAEMLDAVSTEKPIALNSIDGHSLWLNTKGMEKFGINNAAVEQWGRDIIHVDENGNPNGHVSEGPYTSILIKMNEMSDAEVKKAYLTWQDFAIQHGITAYYEAGCNEKYLRITRELIDEGKWKLRVYTGYLMNENSDDYIADVHEAKRLADKYNCEYLQVIGVKIFMDGVVEAHTAWLLDDYTDTPGYNGVKRFHDFDRTVEMYKECAKLGLNVHQHTIGDGAVKFALDCMEKAETETGNMDMRNALAHLQLLRKQDIKRLCDLNAVAVVAPLWMARQDGYYDQAIKYIGEKRNFYSYPLKSFLDNAGILAFHSDYPVSTDMSFQRSIYMACQRNEPGQEDFYQWNANECITRLEALAGITAGPAYEVKQEERLGSLCVGCVANMVVYDANFLEDDLKKISDSTLIATVLDGEEVYRA